MWKQTCKCCGDKLIPFSTYPKDTDLVGIVCWDCKVVLQDVEQQLSACGLMECKDVHHDYGQ